MKHVISIGVVPFYIQNDIRRYLVLQHAGVSAHWDFPKGKVENGEDKLQTALRELQEEAGITATILPGFEYSFSYYSTDYPTGERIFKTVYFYVGQAATHDIRLSHEHQDYAWLSYDEARKRLTYDNAKKLLDEIQLFLEHAGT